MATQFTLVLSMPQGDIVTLKQIFHCCWVSLLLLLRYYLYLNWSLIEGMLIFSNWICCIDYISRDVPISIGGSAAKALCQQISRQYLPVMSTRLATTSFTFYELHRSPSSNKFKRDKGKCYNTEARAILGITYRVGTYFRLKLTTQHIIFITVVELPVHARIN